jgi:hypothetical protein
LCGSTVSLRCDSFKHLYYVARRFFGASSRQRPRPSGKPSYVRSIELLFDLGGFLMDAAALHSGGFVGRARTSPVRLTRRGRRVLLGVLVALAGLVALLIAQPGQAADTSAPPSVVVQPGDTLWSIAGDYAPGRDRIGTIEDIRRLNHLDGYRLQPGQRLVLPRR